MKKKKKSDTTSQNYYSSDLTRDKVIDEKITDKSPFKKDDIDEVDNPQEDIDGKNTTTDTTRFTDIGGVVDRQKIKKEDDVLDSGMPIHPGIDEDTE